jgi:uncharacterized membrane protein
MWELYAPAVIAAFVITLVELTEVVALVFALSADHHTIAHGAAGAVSGTTVVAAIALGFGALLIAFPRGYLLWASAVVLTGFGVFLFRSTLRSYRRSRAQASGAPTATPPSRSSVQFAGGFSVGAIETTEAVVVLLALAAAGFGFSAIVGAVTAGVVLVAATAVVQERIRRIKVPLLKLGATSMLFAFAVFWAGEAASFPWPGADLILVGLFLVGLGVVRGAVELGLRRSPVPAAAA